MVHLTIVLPLSRVRIELPGGQRSSGISRGPGQLALREAPSTGDLTGEWICTQGT